MLHIWQQIYKFICRDSEILTKSCFPPSNTLTDNTSPITGIFFQEKPHLESMLKLALLQGEIMKLAKSVFPGPPRLLCYCSQCGISSFG